MGNLSVVKGLMYQYSDKTISFQSAHKEFIFIFRYECKHNPMNFCKKMKWNFLQDAILVHHSITSITSKGKRIFYDGFLGSKFKYVIEGVWKTQNSDLENSNLETTDLTSKMRLKSIAPLQMEKRSKANLSVGGNA